MRLVDGEERDPRARELGEEALVVEALRRDVEELQRAGPEPFEDLALLGGVEARVEPCGLDPAPLQEVDLILHQRDQRRDHDRHPVEQQRRQLIAEALARSGREDGQRGPPGEERLDDSFLSRAEGVEAEPRGEDVERTHSRHFLAGHARQANGGNETRGERMSRLIITTAMRFGCDSSTRRRSTLVSRSYATSRCDQGVVVVISETRL